jgi:ABC-type Fe3+-hydroxamate transport system substrate-binding protein
MLFIDQLNRTIQLNAFPPKRIVSVVPSQTELLFDLGLNEEVIGITKFCTHPDKWFRSKKRIGGTKQLNVSAIKELRPDLIIANKEENLQQQVDELAEGFPVWTSHIKNLQEACDMIRSVGELVGKSDRAREIIDNITKNFAQIDTKNYEHPRAAYLIWKDPLMTVGGDTFIHDMMNHAGLKNIFADKKRYPTTSFEELNSLNCELLLLSSEPFPFKQVHADEIQKHLLKTNIILVDGEMFSWYGSRLQYAPAYFAQLRELVFNS